MVDRKLRHTLSAVAWVGALLCSLSLLVSATAAAGFTGAQAAQAAPVEGAQP